MKKLKPIMQIEGYLVNASISLSDKRLNGLKELLQNINQYDSETNGICKRMTCAPNWLLLRHGISIRVLINLCSQPRQVWVIRRQDLNKACKAIKTRHYC